MRMTQGWTGLRTAVIALGLFACASTGANADSILTYGTAGSIDATLPSDGVTGTNVISFVPITNASVDANSNISLGYFHVDGRGSRPVDDVQEYAVQHHLLARLDRRQRSHRHGHDHRCLERHRDRKQLFDGGGHVQPAFQRLVSDRG